MSSHPSRIGLALAIALAAACSDATGPAAYEFAGTYHTATKFGGAAGTWHPGPDLVITSDQVVIYGGTTINNPTFEDATVAWTRADGNTHNADFTLMTSSTSAYFWDAPVSGKLFQGRRQSAGEGYVDFRGLAE
jgi:hypothetical protein